MSPSSLPVSRSCGPLADPPADLRRLHRCLVAQCLMLPTVFPLCRNASGLVPDLVREARDVAEEVLDLSQFNDFEDHRGLG